jgi:hypothetical protein
MMPGPRELARFLLDEGTRAASRVAGAMMKDPRGQDAVARAVGAAQRGSERLARIQERLLHAMGLAARPDYEELTRRLARVKRKIRELSKRVEEEKRSR